MNDSGTFDRITSKTKETTGKITNNRETEAESKLRQVEDRIKGVTEDAKDAIKGVVNHLRGDK